MVVDAFESLRRIEAKRDHNLLGEPHGKYGKALVERKEQHHIERESDMPGVKTDPNPGIDPPMHTYVPHTQKVIRTILEAMA